VGMVYEPESLGRPVRPPPVSVAVPVISTMTVFVPDVLPVITTADSVVGVGVVETFAEVLSVFASLVVAAFEVAASVLFVAAAAADVRFGNSVVAAALLVDAAAVFWAKAVEESRPVVSRVESSTVATGCLRNNCIVLDMLAHSQL